MKNLKIIRIIIVWVGILSFVSCKRTQTYQSEQQVTFLQTYPEEGSQRAWFVKEIPNTGFFVISSKDTSYGGFSFQVIYLKHFDLIGNLVQSQRLNIHNFIQGPLISKSTNGNYRLHGRFIGSRYWKFGYYEINEAGKLVGSFNVTGESGVNEGLIEKNPLEYLYKDEAKLFVDYDGIYDNRTLDLENAYDDPYTWGPGCFVRSSLFADSIRPVYGAIYDFSEAENDGDERTFKVIGDFIYPPFSDESNTGLGIYTVKQKRDDNLNWLFTRETRVETFHLFDHFKEERTNQGLLHAWLKTSDKLIAVSGPHFSGPSKKYYTTADRESSMRNGLTIRIFDPNTQDLLVERNINLPYSVRIQSLHEGKSGRIYLAGYIDNADNNTQPLGICLNQSGRISWVHRLNNLEYGTYYAATECSDGSVLFAGFTNAFGSGFYNSDILIVKCNQENGKIE